MDRTGIQASGYQLAGIVDRRELRVDRAYVWLGNGDESVLVQEALFKVREVEGTALDDRSAYTRSVLRLGQPQLGSESALAALRF